jgi:hypothetical protein
LRAYLVGTRLKSGLNASSAGSGEESVEGLAGAEGVFEVLESGFGGEGDRLGGFGGLDGEGAIDLELAEVAAEAVEGFAFVGTDEGAECVESVFEGIWGDAVFALGGARAGGVPGVGAVGFDLCGGRHSYSSL